MIFDDIQKILDSKGYEGAIHKLFDDIDQIRKDIEELRKLFQPSALNPPQPATIPPQS